MKRNRLLLSIFIILLSVVLSACGKKTDTNKTLNESVKDTENNIIEIRDINERIKEAQRDKYTQLVVGDAVGKEKICVPIYLVNNPGLIGLSFTLYYDESQMELESVEANKDFEKILSFTPSKELNSGCTFMWAGETISKEEIKDSEILKLYFKAKDNAGIVKTPINVILSKDGAYDNNLSLISVTVNNGLVLIK